MKGRRRISWVPTIESMKSMQKVFHDLMLLVLGGLLILVAVNHLPGVRQAVAAEVKIHLDERPLTESDKPGFSFAPMVKRVLPGVVQINTTTIVPTRRFPFFDEGFFPELFRGRQPERESEPDVREQKGLGSGVIVTSDGYILTNNHVIAGADEITVTLGEFDKVYEAKVIGTDSHTDIAVLKVEAEDLPAVTLTDSDLLEVGDVVLAIGNPLRAGKTVTMGIVSAKGRSYGMLDYEDFIQTDASINQGNSGGALVDVAGRLVGINTFIISQTGGNLGIGFAVPVNMARHVMEQLIENGRVVRGFLGVGIQPVTPELAEAFDLDEVAGAIVSQAHLGTPAAEAGLKSGDVIVSFDGRKIDGVRNLRLIASRTAPGTEVEVEFVRDGKRESVKVTLAELPEDREFASSREPYRPQSNLKSIPGLELDELTDELREEMDIPVDVRGVLISSVVPRSTAAEKGVQPGDVIVAVNKNPVGNRRELSEELAEDDDGENVLLMIYSGGGSRFVVLPLEEE